MKCFRSVTRLFLPDLGQLAKKQSCKYILDECMAEFMKMFAGEGY